MRKLSVIIALVILCSGVNAQKKNKSGLSNSGTTSFSVGLEAGLPTGVIHYSSSFVLGGTIQVQKMISADAALTLNSGYLSYLGKNLGNGIKTTASGFIPVLAGAKYYFGPSIFGHAQLGIAISTSQNGGTYLSYAPGLGLKFTENVDAELKYFAISGSGGTIGQFGVRVGYNF